MPPQKKGAQPPLNFRRIVCYGQTAGWIKMPLGTAVGHCPGDIVLDGDPQNVKTAPVFSLCCVETTGWMKMPLGIKAGLGGRPRRHCVRWGPMLPAPKQGHSHPQFSTHDCCGQTAGWINMPLGTEVGLCQATLC